MRSGQNIGFLVLLIAVSITSIEGGRRGFGKRFSKPSKGGSRAAVKDTTSEPEPAPHKDDNDTLVSFFMADAEIKCKGAEMKLSEKAMAHMKTCAAAAGVASKKDLTPDKVPCFAKCIFENKKLVDEKGMPHKENILTSFTEPVPDNMKEDVKASIAKCLDDHASKVDPKDPTCHTYTPLAMCIHMAYSELCQPE